MPKKPMSTLQHKSPDFPDNNWSEIESRSHVKVTLVSRLNGNCVYLLFSESAHSAILFGKREFDISSFLVSESLSYLK